jgi:hypothetical protein
MPGATSLDLDWIRLRPGLSWHVFRTWTREPNVAVTLCGRRTPATEPPYTKPYLPHDEKSCESCARIVLRQADPG